MLAIKSIQFDRSANGTPTALPLRATSSGSPAPLDWVRGADIQRQPVAYPRSAAGHDLTVTVELAITAPIASEVLVRAVARNDAPLRGVENLTVPPAGSGTVTRQGIIAQELAAQPVGRTDVHWAWEWSKDGGASWVVFDETRHVVYVLLDEPQFPWGRFENTQRVAPWVDAVDQACEWAAGTVSEDQAARSITEGVHALGGQLIQDCNGDPQSIGWQSNTDYHDGRSGRPTFLCSAFLRLVRLKRTDFYQLNCLDCASAVGTFATVLGIPMEVTEIRAGDGAEELGINPVWLIGATAAREEPFFEHNVPSRGRDGALRIWDACLKVDFDTGPTFDWAVPAAVPFVAGSMTTVGYRSLLIKSDEPEPTLVQGEPISFPDHPPPDAEAVDSPAARRKRESLARMPERRVVARHHGQVDDLTVFRQLGVDDRLIESRPLVVAGAPYQQRHAPLPLEGSAKSRLRLDLILTDSAAHAQEAFADIVVRFTTPLRPVRDIGDKACYCRADESIVAVRGPAVLWLRNDPQRAVPIRSEMRRLDALLASILGPFG